MGTPKLYFSVFTKSPMFISILPFAVVLIPENVCNILKISQLHSVKNTPAKIDIGSVGTVERRSFKIIALSE